MIHSARPTIPPAAIIILNWKLFWSVRFWKVGTDWSTDIMCEKIVITTGHDCGSVEWIKKVCLSFNILTFIFFSIDAFSTDHNFPQKNWNDQQLFLVSSSSVVVWYTSTTVRCSRSSSYLLQYYSSQWVMRGKTSEQNLYNREKL